MRIRISITRGAAMGTAALLAAFVPATASAAGPQNNSGFNQPGNILIADQFNNRVVEVDRQHRVVWHFGDGSSVAGPKSSPESNSSTPSAYYVLVTAQSVVLGRKSILLSLPGIQP